MELHCPSVALSLAISSASASGLLRIREVGEELPKPQQVWQFRRVQQAGGGIPNQECHPKL